MDKISLRKLVSFLRPGTFTCKYPDLFGRVKFIYKIRKNDIFSLTDSAICQINYPYLPDNLFVAHSCK